MKKFLLRLTVTALSLLTLSLPGFAGHLDEHYLNRLGELPGSALQKAVLFQPTEMAESAHCGTPLKHGLQRDWNKLESATQKTLAKQLAAPVLINEATFTSSGGHFKIHYATSGTDAPPALDTNANGIPDWVETVAQTFEQVRTTYVSQGYNPAPTVAGVPYDLYLRELAAQRLYGQTTSDQAIPAAGFANAFTSFMEIDNDFLEDIYVNTAGGPYTALQNLQITAAHEYHHAIQYGYNFFFDVWYAEATSNWNEDELYDGVNQLYNYLQASMSNTNLSLDIPTDITTGGGYGRWLLNRHFAETHGGQGIVRGFWESLATKTPVNGNDIPMLPIIDAVLQTTGSSLGNDLLGYASKLYNTGAWTTHQTEIGLMHAVSKLSTSSIYPITVATVPSPAITLPHYSFAYFRLLPPAAAPATLNITLTRDNGISVIAFRKTNNTITSFSPNPGTNLIVIPGFDTASEVVLLATNTTSSDNLFVGFSSDGSPIQYALPRTTIISAVSSTSPPSITLSWTAVGEATSYQIYRSSTSSTSLVPYDTTLTTTYTDTNVITDHTYYYSVVPIKAAGLIGPASQISFTKVTPTAPAVASGGGGGGGCFIATAAYGSYLHPQVQLLRDFRDRHLLTNAPGRAFVALYYRISPPLADFIAQHVTLRLLVRLLLTPVVFAVKYPPALIAALLFAACGTLAAAIRRRPAIAIERS